MANVSTDEHPSDGRGFKIFVGFLMFLITVVLCIVLIGTLSVGGDPTVLVTGVIALFGVLITMTFRINRGARYEAQAVAQEAIAKEREEFERTVKRIVEEEVRTVARKAMEIAEKEETIKLIVEREVKAVAQREVKRLQGPAAGEAEEK